jgi:hypothetical protein
MLGDTTATQSLILSPIIAKLNLKQPTYPDYRISSPYPLNDSLPTNVTSMRVIVIPTTESPDAEHESTGSLGNSQCAVLRAEQRTGSIARNTEEIERTEGTLQQRPEGWRWAFLTGGLEPLVNYTAWVVEETGGHRGTMWQPVMMRTKEGESYGFSVGGSLLISCGRYIPVSPRTFLSSVSINSLCRCA